MVVLITRELMSRSGLRFLSSVRHVRQCTISNLTRLVHALQFESCLPSNQKGADLLINIPIDTVLYFLILRFCAYHCASGPFAIVLPECHRLSSESKKVNSMMLQ
jgi:hypothetical protein